MPLKTVKGAHLDGALMEQGRQLKGCNQRTWCAELIYELTQVRAWEKAAEKALSHEVLEEHCKLYSTFFLKLAPHDIFALSWPVRLQETQNDDSCVASLHQY